MAKKKVPEKIKDIKVELVEVGVCPVSKNFRIHATTKQGKDIYLGRHEIEVGRDDIVSISVQEEVITIVERNDDEEGE